MKFKQGFGRLMRQKEDRGCVLCLDRRLLTKSYGKFFLKSLPDTGVCFGLKNQIFEEMRKFYALDLLRNGFEPIHRGNEVVL